MRVPPPPARRLAPRLALASAAIALVFMAAIGLCILPDVRENADAVLRGKLSEAACAAVGVAAAYARLEGQGAIPREKAQADALEGLRELNRQYGGTVLIWVIGQNGPLLEPDPPALNARVDLSENVVPPQPDEAAILSVGRGSQLGYQPDARLWREGEGAGDGSSGRGAFASAFSPWRWVLVASAPPTGELKAENPLRDRILLVTLAALAVAAGVFLFVTRLGSRADEAMAKADMERRALVLALEESEHKFRDIFTNAPLGICRTTRDGRFLAANAELARIYGYESPKELMLAVTCTPDQIYVDPEDRTRLLKLLDEKGRADNFECRSRRKDGSVIWTSRNVRAVVDASGRHLYNEGFLRDVTARVRSADAMREARDKAQAASLMKTRFLSLITHETLTPMTSILGFARLVKKKLETSVSPAILQTDQAARRQMNLAIENLDVIAQEGERLIGIIQNVLTLADLESGAVQWNMAACPADRLVGLAREKAAPLFAGVNASLDLEVAPDAPWTRCDQGKIVDALVRLLANAAKFAPEGRTVLSARGEDGMLALAVADEGPGISPENREAAFGIFDQAGDHLTDKPSGMGLGLPIVRAIAEGHGGALRLDDAPGAGCVFTLLLPVFDTRNNHSS